MRMQLKRERCWISGEVGSAMRRGGQEARSRKIGSTDLFGVDGFAPRNRSWNLGVGWTSGVHSLCQVKSIRIGSVKG